MASTTVIDTFIQEVRINGALDYNGTFSLPRTRSITGTSNPKYKQIIKDGGDASTPMTASMQIMDSLPGHATAQTVYVPFNVNEQFVITYHGFSPQYGTGYPGMNNLIQEAQARCRSKALNKLFQLQNSFNGQVILGELRETIQLLRNPLGAGVNLTKALVQKRKKGAHAADAWLEYRFGILPLISDISSIIDLVSETADKKKSLAYRVYSRSTEVSTSRQSFRPVPGPFGFDVYEELTDYAECVIHFGVLGSVIDKHFSLAGKFINTIDDLSSLPVTAWELVPFSFLVDYFVNVGDIIQAATQGQSALQYSSESVITNSKRYERSVNCGLVSQSYAPYSSVKSFTPGFYRSNVRNVNRTVGPIGIPPLVVGLPGSNIKLLNIAALLASIK